ncbi:hypothetical protein [Halalkalibacterium halodurans]|uniref:Uncharacterized protein n=1 Tax=Halalkalibacterium halodurans TaxID=86665 RepID=A0A0M0KIP6_ALKHA|nr:hypothetical protein [Halalkalibacterium halodurans]TPE68951.1 hypothetical protein AMD02_010915 [Halalkalibacterium halodurans]
MDCIYKVRDHYGAYGSDRTYFERDGYRPFYPDGAAFINYRAQPMPDGCYFLGFEVSTQTGEVVALKRWASREQTELTAKIEALKAAVSAACAYDDRVRCFVGGELAENVIKKLEREYDEWQTSLSQD